MYVFTQSMCDHDIVVSCMPHTSPHQELLDDIHRASQSAQQLRLQLLLAEILDDDDLDLISHPLLTIEAFCDTPSPMSTTLDSSNLSSASLALSTSNVSTSSISTSSSGWDDHIFTMWDQYLQATEEEICFTWVLQIGLPPVPCAPQIHFLNDHHVHRPHKFHQVMCVSPDTFNALVAKIVDHPVFYNNSHCPQIPPPTQLAIFLHCAGHYGDNSGPDTVADWVGLSTGAVNICTKCVMVTILHLHDQAFGPPLEEDSTWLKEYAASVTCPAWSSGKLLLDGSLFLLYQWPGLHGDAWFDRKSNYSLNAQVCISWFKEGVYSLSNSLSKLDFCQLWAWPHQ